MCIYIYIYIWNGILLSQRKEWNNAISSNLDEPRHYHSNWSKSDRERQISWYCLNVESKKMMKMNLFTKQIDSDIENKFMVPKGKWGSDKLGVWD